MEWLNVFGLVMVAVIMIPNILFAMKCKDGFVNKWNNKSVETVEQIGRFGCFGFMIINIPGTWFGWWSDEAFAVYLVVDAVLVTLYCVIWAACFRKSRAHSAAEDECGVCMNIHEYQAKELFADFSVPVQRDYEPVDSPDHCRGIVCAEPYSDFVSKRKMISPQEVTIC